MTDFLLRRKWTIKAHGRQVVLVKRPGEKAEHVIMKALLWALYLPAYPDLGIELKIGDRYKPDVVTLDPAGRPRFWGEAGQVGVDKIRSIARRFPETHLAFAKWNLRPEPFHALLQETLREVRRTAPTDFIVFPPESAERFFDENGRVQISFEEIEWRRI